VETAVYHPTPGLVMVAMLVSPADDALKEAIESTLLVESKRPPQEPAGRSEMRAGREVAVRVSAGLSGAPVKRVVLDRGHVVQAESRERCLGHGVLIAVRVLSDTGYILNDSPVPIIDWTEELGMLPVTPPVGAKLDDAGL
jgi:hypothetical protein